MSLQKSKKAPPRIKKQNVPGGSAAEKKKQAKLDFQAKRREKLAAAKAAGKKRPRFSRTIDEKPSRKALRTRCEALCRTYNKLVNPGCVAAGYTFGTRVIPCQGDDEWCHLKGRKEVRLILHPLNFTRMCKHHHYWFTNHPDEWTKFIQDLYPDEDRWQRLNDLINDPELRGIDTEYWLDFYQRKLAELKN